MCWWWRFWGVMTLKSVCNDLVTMLRHARRFSFVRVYTYMGSEFFAPPVRELGGVRGGAYVVGCYVFRPLWGGNRTLRFLRYVSDLSI